VYGAYSNTNQHLFVLSSVIS